MIADGVDQIHPSGLPERGVDHVEPDRLRHLPRRGNINLLDDSAGSSPPTHVVVVKEILSEDNVDLLPGLPPDDVQKSPDAVHVIGKREVHVGERNLEHPGPTLDSRFYFDRIRVLMDDLEKLVPLPIVQSLLDPSLNDLAVCIDLNRGIVGRETFVSPCRKGFFIRKCQPSPFSKESSEALKTRRLILVLVEFKINLSQWSPGIIGIYASFLCFDVDNDKRPPPYSQLSNASRLALYAT